jgi:4-hydroxy-tetrahydrodipicolinate synthase
LLTAKEVIKGRTALIVGTGGTRTEDSVAYAKHAREIGADAILGMAARPGP